jgi:hypothetical protein
VFGLRVLVGRNIDNISPTINCTTGKARYGVSTHLTPPKKVRRSIEKVRRSMEEIPTTYLLQGLCHQQQKENDSCDQYGKVRTHQEN